MMRMTRRTKWASALALVAALAAPMAGAALVTSAQEREAALMGQKVEAILGGTRALYVALVDYRNLSNELLLRAHGVTGATSESFKTPWGAPIKVSAESLSSKDDAFSIQYKASAEPASETCAFLKTIEVYFRTVSLGGRALKPDVGEASWSCEGIKPGAQVILIGS